MFFSPPPPSASFSPRQTSLHPKWDPIPCGMFVINIPWTLPSFHQTGHSLKLWTYVNIWTITPPNSDLDRLHLLLRSRFQSFISYPEISWDSENLWVNMKPLLLGLGAGTSCIFSPSHPRWLPTCPNRFRPQPFSQHWSALSESSLQVPLHSWLKHRDPLVGFWQCRLIGAPA